MRTFRATDVIERHPGACFAAFLLLQAVTRTVEPALLHRVLPLDLVEALVYGPEWQIGYFKLPPLPWWLAEATFRLVPRDAALYALSQLFVVVTFIVVWLMARRLVGPVGALVAVLIIDGLDYFQGASDAFNHDVAQLPFWALAGSALHAALRGGGRRDWAILGLALGGAFWAKYFVAVLVAPIALFLIFDPDARPALRRSGPWIAVAVALLVALPHLVWLVQNDFIPLDFVRMRAVAPRGVTDHVVRPAQFALSQLGYMIPSLLICAPLVFFSPRTPTSAALGVTPAAPVGDDFDRRIVTMLAFGPALSVIALSVITGRTVPPLWGYPLWLYFGLWLVMRHAGGLASRSLAWTVGVWTTVFAAYAGVAIGFDSGLFGTRYLTRSYSFPGPQLGREVEQRFLAITGHPLRYVAGPLLVVGNIARYAPGRPRAVIDGSLAHAPWIDPADLRASGALLIWKPSHDGDAPELMAGLGAGAIRQPDLTIPVANGAPAFVFAWAILPPQPTASQSGAGPSRP